MSSPFDQIPPSHDGQQLDHWHYSNDYTRVYATYGVGCESVEVTITLDTDAD